MNVVDMFKKSIAFGLGAAAFSAEKLKQFSDEMVARGEMSSDEAKTFVDDMTKKADEEKSRLQDWINEQMSKMLQQAGAAEAARVERLEMRVAHLEKRIAHIAGDVDTDECKVAYTEETEDVDFSCSEMGESEGTA